MMGEVCSTSMVLCTCKVLGALTNQLPEHGNDNSHHEEKHKPVGSPVFTLNTKGEELDSNFPMKIEKDSLINMYFRCF